MNFFEQQAQARRQTRRLLLLFAGATAFVVAAVCAVVALIAYNLGNDIDALRLPDPAWLADRRKLLFVTAAACLGAIASTSTWKMFQLRRGGAAVAEMLGGRRLERGEASASESRLLNIVEEMTVAAGVPAPEVYVLDGENSINALAAGYSASDAAIAVTRGCIEKLTRDELQGVVAHEFGHILGGDTRLNMRMLGLLHGIMSVGISGEALIRMAGPGLAYRSGRGADRRTKGSLGPWPMYAAGGLLMFAGHLGFFLGSLIKAAVSRQRELLADASAVQFTRNPVALARALEKVAGVASVSHLQNRHAEEVSHMLFGEGRPYLLSFFSTHPPLEARIARLDHHFDPRRFAEYRRQVRTRAALDGSPLPEINDPSVSNLAGAGFGRIAADRLEAVAETHDAGHLAYASRLLAGLPTPLRDAAGFPDEAEAVVFALLLSSDAECRDEQLILIGARHSRQRRAQTLRLAQFLEATGAEVRLPLIDLCLPALRRRDRAGIADLLDTVEALVQADHEIEVFEYALSKVLRCHLVDAARPTHAGGGRGGLAGHCDDVATVLSLVSGAGDKDVQAQTTAYCAGVAELKNRCSPDAKPPCRDVDDLDAALSRLDRLGTEAKHLLTKALTAAAAHDRLITPEESELLRAVCETLHVPLPPLGPFPPSELNPDPKNGIHVAYRAPVVRNPEPV